MRTPSKLENQRKARELRQMIQSEKPVPMAETSNRMPDELEEGQNRPGFVFNQDDGGFRATHEDNTPGDEIYYLGVIDCLTHYGIIKKIEHFWKGLSSDRSQISALPPYEYGERFINFISGVTMSQEEAIREAQARDAAAAAEAAASDAQHRAGSLGDNTSIPPAPNYQPPLPPTPVPSGQRSAAYEPAGQKSEQTSAPNPAKPERRETTVLPVVEEAAEGTSTGDRTRNSHISTAGTIESEGRPLTPAKDGYELEPGFSNPLLGIRSSSSNGSHGRPPPTPPKAGHGYNGQAKPESADSGYGVGGSNGSNGVLRSLTGSQKSLNGRAQLSRDSLDKALPPLPKVNSPTAQGLS
jgi:1-phosphatidylinositol-4-phosphate 5-kinase